MDARTPDTRRADADSGHRRQCGVSRAARIVAVVGLLAATAAPAGADSGDVAFDAGLQWGLVRIGAEAAWEVSRGDGITIAVIDSGLAVHHEDLAGKLVNGVGCRGTGGDPDACTGSPGDEDGHGTHVAGVAAAVTGNGTGIAGVAPEADIMPVKVLFTECPTCQSSGNADDVAAGIRWAAERGADVINLSLGSTTSSVFGPSFAEAIDFAWSQGAIPVVAAGNDYVLTADLGDAPALVVSATDRDDAAPPYSNGIGSARWAIAAPGGDGSDTPESCSQDGAPRGILSTYWAADDDTSAYACLSGTSMAAPHVSGALALLLADGYTPEEAVARLLETAVDVGDPGFDPVFGAGRLDMAAALAPRATDAPPLSPRTIPATTDTGVSPAAPPSTPPGATRPPSRSGGPGTSAQLFVQDTGAEASVPLVLLAALAILAVGAAHVVALRRLRR